jgi:trehalose synthase
MFGTVAFTPRQITEYVTVAGAEPVERLRAAAGHLGAARVLNLSMAAQGTALTDLLAVQTPLLRDLGLQAEWQTARTSEQSTRVNRELFAALNGRAVNWNESARATWAEYVDMNAALLTEPYEVVVVHDPQLLPLAERARGRAPASRWLWHCHLDLSGALPEVWADLAPSVAAYDAVLIDHPEFAPPGMTHADLRVVPPAIDPLGPRCMPVDRSAGEDILRRSGLDPARPIVAQIGPLDPESQVEGVLAAFDAVRGSTPGMQLLLVATHLAEDERTRTYFEAIGRAVNERPDATLLSSDLHNLGNVELNIFQERSAVVMHLSLRRGYGLWVAEAMWKARPVIVGPRGGLPRLVEDGVSGFVVADAAAAAERLSELLRDRDRAAALGRAAQARVAERFLIPRLLQDYLEVFRSVTAGAPA